MSRKLNILGILVVMILGCSMHAFTQSGLLNRIPRGGGGGAGAAQDSLGHRTGLEDSITITFRYLDSSRYNRFDSSFSDFTRRFPVPAHYAFLGNTGNAARSLIFNPVRTAGWDPGFHAYDIYQFTIPETRFYNTTRPYSELGYVLGTKTEQLINIIHTQNISPDWNAAFEYRMINAPGTFINQNTNHNSYRLSSLYHSVNRRYHAFFIVINNKLASGENGGIRSDTNYLDNTATYGNRLTVPVQLGREPDAAGSVFNSTINTGTKYKNLTLMFRQQYDFGIKDSIVNDSSVIMLFYPKLRVEHTIRSTSYSYTYTDVTATDPYPAKQFYERNYNVVPTGPFILQDKWSELVNDVSFYQFPDSKNAQQFFKAGGSLQNLKGTTDSAGRSLYNFFAHGEYRNKTRNQKWDIEANGQLYLLGFNAGDYSGVLSLKRLISRKIGYLQAGFQNVNRTPSFVYNNASTFNFGNTGTFNKENITNIFGSLEQPRYKLKLTGSYYLITNYSYFRDYYHTAQSAALFNLLQVSADKEFHLSRHLIWYAQLTVQQKAGAAPVNVPLVYTRHRIGYEGNLGFKNLTLLFGTELRYHTPYKPDNYSPVTGQFFYQDTTTIGLNMPRIDAYLHFRIKSFTAYVRAENLNSASFRDGFGFYNNNFAAPLYPYPGLLIRLGVYWSFVN